RCTGRNSCGQVGDSSLLPQSHLIVIAVPNAISVVRGTEHNCALIGDGTMQCWGANYTGQLGDGTMGGYSVAPVTVHNLTTVIRAATGGYHSCALLSDHTVNCWGRNQDGQLGNGDSTTDVPLPVAVAGLSGVVDVAG